MPKPAIGFSLSGVDGIDQAVQGMVVKPLGRFQLTTAVVSGTPESAEFLTILCRKREFQTVGMAGDIGQFA